MTEETRSASILIIDDTEGIRNQIKQILQKQKGLIDHLYEAENGVEGFKKLLNHKIDLILCDVVMPQIDGFKLLGMVKNHPELKDIPIIMLTAEKEQNKKNQGLAQGASDYLTKPCDEVELVARVRVHLELKLLQDKLKDANRQLTALSITDALTQVYNRRHLMKVMVDEILRARRYKSDLSFLLLDVDNFKALNDTHGHQAGDQVLIDICLRVSKTLRGTDILARYGGEEFAVLLYQVPLSGAEKVAGKIREVISGAPFQVGGLQIPVTVTCGISCFAEGVADTIDTIIMEADKALYEGKRTGKNRVIVSQGCLNAAPAEKSESEK